MAEWEGATVRLQTRNGADATNWYPELASALAGVGPGHYTIDGELAR